MITPHDLSVRIVRSNGEVNPRHPNFFLTNQWVLIIDQSGGGHEVAMQRLGLESADLLEQGFLNQHGPLFKSSPGQLRGEITDEQHMELLSAMRTLLTRYALQQPVSQG